MGPSPWIVRKAHVKGYRVLAVALALAGLGFAAFVEFGTPRAPEVQRSFGWFAFEAGPYAVALVLALLSPFWRALSIAGVLALVLEGYAYYSVFVAPLTEDAPLIYLRKPFYHLAIIAVLLLGAFLLSRRRDAR